MSNSLHPRDLESRIVHENGPFYAFQVKPGVIEIRKNGDFYATLIGTVANLAQAKRFIDRAAKYPHNF